MRLTALFSTLLLAAILPAAQAETRIVQNYVDVSAYPLSEAQYEAWIRLQTGLRRDFDDICGDTFCEGEYSNIQSLRYRCSVHRDNGRIGMCAWMFAASNEEISPSTGAVNVSQQGFWRCVTPLVKGTTIEQLIQALDVDEPLYAPLPGTSESTMDGLIDCL